MMVDFFLISSQASISTFSTMEDQRNGSNKSSYFWWKYIDVDLSYWKSHQQFPIKHRPYFGEVDLGAPPGSPRTKPAMIQCSLRASHKFVKLMISWAMKDNVPSTTRLDCSRLNFTNFFLGGGSRWKVQGFWEILDMYISWNCLPWLLWGGEVFTFNDIIWKIKNCQLKVMGFSLTRCLSKWETSNSDNYSWGLSTIETRCY